MFNRGVDRGTAPLIAWAAKGATMTDKEIIRASARLLGARNRGRKKTLTAEARAKLAARLARVRPLRWAKGGGQ